MKHRNKKQLGAWMAGIVFLAVLVFSVFFVAAETNHACTGQGCPICAEIALCVSLLRATAAAGVAVAVALRVIFSVRRAIGRSNGSRRPQTPVSLRVLLLD